MLFIDRDLEIHTIFPGLVSGDNQVACTQKAGSGGEDFYSDLNASLRAGVGLSRWSQGALPSLNDDGFWSSFHLVNRSSVSQYDVLRRVISGNRGLPGNVVCLALAGDDFHGQQGRTWSAVKGNLHLTLGLRCDLPAAESGLALTMLPAVAVMDALTRIGSVSGAEGPAKSGIKWVNDILIDGRKLGGVLTSARSVKGRVESAVLGIGLNVGMAPDVAPTPFTPGVTCLADHFQMPSGALEIALTAVLEAVAVRFCQLSAQGPEPLLEAYRQSSLVIGRRVRVVSGDHPAESRQGTVLGIGADLGLTLTDGPAPVTQGRLILLPEG